MGTVGTILGVLLCVGLLGYIGVSIARICISFRKKRNISDEFDDPKE